MSKSSDFTRDIVNRIPDNIPVEVLIDPAWAQQPGEPDLAFERFTRYCNQIGRRSMLRVYQDEQKEKYRVKVPHALPPLWKDVVRKWRWTDRVALFDEYVKEENEAKWQERRDNHLEQEYEMAQTFGQDFKKLHKEFENRADYTPGTKDLERCATNFSKLGRLATGMATDRQEANMKIEEAAGAGAIAKALTEDPDAIKHINEALLRAANRDTGVNGVDG